MLSWEEYTNGSSKYTVSATNNITGETIIQKHGTTAPESVTSQDTKTQDTEDATQAPPPPPKNHKIQHHKPPMNLKVTNPIQKTMFSSIQNNTFFFEFCHSHAHAFFHTHKIQYRTMTTNTKCHESVRAFTIFKSARACAQILRVPRL